MAFARCIGLVALVSSAAVSAAAQEPVAPDAMTATTADAATFDISAYDVLGNSVLSRDEIERAVYPFLGPGRTAQDVEAARTALEKAYHAKGYQSVFVQVPQQSASTGLLSLQVTEAKVARIKVAGVDAGAEAGIARRVPALRQGGVPNLRQAEAELAAANRFRERQITPLIEPGEEPGTINVELSVEETSPLHGTLQLSNDYSAGTRPLRLLGSLRHSNLWGWGHQLTATYLMSPEDRDDIEVFSGSYLAPLGGSQWSLLAYGYKSNSNVASLGGTNVLGNGYAIGARAILNLPSKRSGFFHSVNFGIDYKNFDESISIAGIDETVDTPIDYPLLAAAYTMGIAGDHDSVNATLAVSAGLRGLTDETVEIFGNEYPVFGNKRGSLSARPNFVHLNLDGDYSHAFKNDIVLFARFSGQIADGPLVSNEQFAAGGLGSARGYLQSEAVGDDGVNLGVELRSPSFGPKLASFIDEWRVFGFTDGAVVWMKEAAEGVEEEVKLWSAGVGTRFQLFKYLSGEAVLGWPIERSARGYGPYATFSIKAEY